MTTPTPAGPRRPLTLKPVPLELLADDQASPPPRRPKRTETPFYRLPDAERIALLVPHTGRPVRLHVTPIRGVDEHAQVVAGGLVAVARMPFGGTTTSVAVIRTAEATDRVAVAVELAKIRRVEVPR